VPFIVAASSSTVSTHPTPAGLDVLDPFHPYGITKHLEDKPVRGHTARGVAVWRGAAYTLECHITVGCASDLLSCVVAVECCCCCHATSFEGSAPLKVNAAKVVACASDTGAMCPAVLCCFCQVDTFEGSDTWLQIMAAEKAGLIKVDLEFKRSQVSSS
jgi:hypothetical protein